MSSSQMNNKIIKQNKINFQKLHLNKLEEYVLSKKKKNIICIYIYIYTCQFKCGFRPQNFLRWQQNYNKTISQHPEEKKN